MMGRYVAVVVAILLCACAPLDAPDSIDAGEPAQLRLIVAFESEVDATEGQVQRLSKIVGYDLIWLRTMSGGAVVVVTREPLLPVERVELVDRIRVLPEILYVEEDMIMRPTQ